MNDGEASKASPFDSRDAAGGGIASGDASTQHPFQDSVDKRADATSAEHTRSPEEDFEIPAKQTELLRKLKAVTLAREKFFKSFAVSATVSGGGLGEDENSGAYDLVIDEDRLRCTAAWGEQRLDTLIADGVTQALVGNKDGWTNATIANGPQRIPWGFEIHYALTKCFATPTTSFLEDLLTGVKVDGSRIVVDAQPGRKENQDVEFRIQAEFSSDYGYSLLGVTQFFRANATEEWKLNSRIQMSGFTEYARSGFYVPSSADYAIPGVVGYQAKFYKWEIPPEIATDTFVMNLPAGVIVDDQVRGVAYIKTEIGDEEIRRSVELPPSVASKTVGGRSLLIAANLIFLAAGALWLFVTRKKNDTK